ncbi:hypothetical protein C4544_00595 [candidate division WS5 bacterium]|uniref:Uncharacterized protein n=1 Tax=candidate division WS5 bacterium TaxID=2093353 RepID=A0A419DGX4_9BACT|nr:MAG: hypothetical protein C4544_00595 [candidate division WS5 bacterium]
MFLGIYALAVYNKFMVLIMLIIYLIFFVLWAAGSAFVIYQHKRYFEPMSRMKLGLSVYIWTSLAIMIFSFYMIYSIDWSNIG